MIRIARRIDPFSNSFAYLDCIVSTSLKRIIWLKRPPYASARLRKNRSGRQNFNRGTFGTRKTHPCRILKKATFSPAQPWRLLHPPALSLPRQPLSPGPRLVPGKAAAVFHPISKGWPGRSSIARVERAPSERARSASRRTTRVPFPSFFSILLENEQAVRHMADGLSDSATMAPIRG
jgi:hypothetical protein